MGRAAPLLLVLSVACGSTAPAPPAEPETPREPRPGPASLEALLSEHDLTGASPARWDAAFDRFGGARVRWELRSWGGELTSGDFEPPEGRATRRTRLISRELGRDADLAAVDEAGHPVVACLEDGPMGAVVVEAFIWGVSFRGGHPTLWLRDCTITAGVEEAASVEPPDDQPSDDDGQDQWQLDADEIAARGFTEDPALAEVVVAAVRDYRATLRAFELEDDEAYERGFAERLECFYGARDVPRARPAGRRGSLCLGALRVLRATRDEVALGELGIWSSEQGGSRAYRKVVVLRRAGDRFVVVAEAGERDACVREDVARIPAREVVCGERRRACAIACEPYCRQASNGCEMCEADCRAREHACHGRIDEAQGEGCY